MKIKLEKSQFIAWYLTLWNGFLGLTSKEIDILTEFIKMRDNLSKVITDSKILNDQLFSSSSRKTIREICGISSENLFNNYFSSLKKKGVIDKFGEGYKLADNIIPNQKINLEIEFTDV